MTTIKTNPVPVMERTWRVHECLFKMVEIKRLLQGVVDPNYPLQSVWETNDVGDLWCDLRTNIAAIYVDFLEQEKMMDKNVIPLQDGTEVS